MKSLTHFQLDAMASLAARASSRTHGFADGYVFAANPRYAQAYRRTLIPLGLVESQVMAVNQFRYRLSTEGKRRLESTIGE